MKYVISLAFLSLVACGSVSKPPKATPDQKQQVQETVAKIRTWAPVCSNGQQTKTTDSDKCDDGDFLLFAGLSCLAGEENQCKYVQESQDTQGRFWRSPLRIEKDDVNAFSRDMALGLLAYVAKTKDVLALERWVDYVKQNNGKMCPLSTDTRCNSGMGIRTLAKLIGNKIGADVNWGNLGVYNRDAYDAELYASARYGESGFPLHLAAVQILILEEIGVSNTYWINVARNALNDRQPGNAFFAHLDKKDDVAVKLFLEQSPKEEPSIKNQWSFERVDSEQAWKNSMGWDLIFLGNLLSR